MMYLYERSTIRCPWFPTPSSVPVTRKQFAEPQVATIDPVPRQPMAMKKPIDRPRFDARTEAPSIPPPARHARLSREWMDLRLGRRKNPGCVSGDGETRRVLGRGLEGIGQLVSRRLEDGIARERQRQPADGRKNRRFRGALWPARGLGGAF